MRKRRSTTALLVGIILIAIGGYTIHQYNLNQESFIQELPFSVILILTFGVLVGGMILGAWFKSFLEKTFNTRL